MTCDAAPRSARQSPLNHVSYYSGRDTRLHNTRRYTGVTCARNTHGLLLAPKGLLRLADSAPRTMVAESGGSTGVRIRGFNLRRSPCIHCRPYWNHFSTSARSRSPLVDPV